MTEEEYIETSAQRVKSARDEAIAAGGNFSESFNDLLYKSGELYERVYHFCNEGYEKYSILAPQAIERYEELVGL